MAAFPSIDLTDVDLAPAARATRDTAEQLAGAAASVARDATYTAVGLGFLGFQRLQVRRRELERAVERLRNS